ncbi:HAD family hydrolase [Halonatronum saccharophilum]|uniref:HAD family hydrolase n=1 Tax=Halonatronum saccharophilum TaxID=150060 RepID=UPI000482FDEC|nr:HAD-IA family hydrolase [Halonatronum saccharophilum]
MIKAILFDLGEVITQTKFENVLKKYSQIYGWKVDDLKERIFSKEYELLLTGKMSLNQFIDYLNEGFGRVDRRELDQFVMEYYQAEVLKDGMKETLANINMNIKLALITNDIGLLDNKLKRLQIDGIFDIIINSHNVGYLKPNIEIYEYALNHLKVSGSECLYIDNNPKALEIASRLGIRTLDFKGVKELEERLKSLNLINK